MAKVAVFPASGKIRRLPSTELLLISRHPGKTPPYTVQAGVLTRKADYNDADWLEHVMQAHLRTESYLKALGLEANATPDQKPFTFTAIREEIYSESFPMYTGFPHPQNLPAGLKIPHD